jgi:hypothetical protein
VNDDVEDARDDDRDEAGDHDERHFPSGPACLLCHLYH